MKKIAFFILSLLPMHSYCQDSTSTIKERIAKIIKEYDELPINKSQENQYYSYGIKLLKKDSLEKAGRIFDRLCRLDSTNDIGKRSLYHRIAIEKKITASIDSALLGKWEWYNCSNNISQLLKTTEQPGKTDKAISLTNDSIIFYTNDTVTRKTGYSLSHYFDWYYGFVSTVVVYEDTKKAWHYNINTPFSFISDRLIIEEANTGVIDGYTECYSKVK